VATDAADEQYERWFLAEWCRCGRRKNKAGSWPDGCAAHHRFPWSYDTATGQGLTAPALPRRRGRPRGPHLPAGHPAGRGSPRPPRHYRRPERSVLWWPG